MNQGHVSEVIGRENARHLDEFMRKSGIPLVVLFTSNVAAIGQAQGSQVDYIALADGLRVLADQAEALGRRVEVLH